MNALVETKAEELAAKLSVSEMNIESLDDQIKTLQGKKKKLLEELEQFKDDLRTGMADSGITRIENAEYGILFRLDAPSERVEIEDESVIPDKFVNYKPTLNKTAIKSALKVGDDVPGARLVEGKHRLTIKA